MRENALHTEYMSTALTLAARRKYTVSPNPMVGCILVKNNQIVGQGWHQFAGQPHAEIYALEAAGDQARGATVYVSLEPCSHFGRTPPCVNALIKAGVANVYVACLDPNSLVNGQGVEALQAAGIKVSVGLCEIEARALNKIFFHFMKRHHPYVIAKWAMSLDGKTITHPRDNRFISSQDSLNHSHEIRQSVDAIVIGSRTAIQDDPLLTVRHTKIIKHPLRFVLASKGDLPFTLKCFDSTLPAKTIVVTTHHAEKAWLDLAASKNIEVWQCNEKNNYIDLQDLLKKMGEAGISSVLVEGGRTLQDSFFQENLVNQVQVYLAPNIIGQLENKKYFGEIKFETCGKDIFLEVDACS